MHTWIHILIAPRLWHLHSKSREELVLRGKVI
jgi:hypothetical protein